MEPVQIDACWEIYNTVLNAKEGKGDAIDKRSHKRMLSKEFRTLPDRQRFAQYYAFIPDPMSLDIIRGRLERNEFAAPADFFRDMHQIFLNAKHFNDEYSQLYKDAEFLEGMIYRLYEARVNNGIFPPPTPMQPPPLVHTVRRRSIRPSKPAPEYMPTPTTAPISAMMRAPPPPSAAVASSTYSRGSSPTKTIGDNDEMATADVATVDEHERMRAEMDAGLKQWNGPEEYLPEPADGPDPNNTVPGSGWWGDDWNEDVPNWPTLAIGVIERLKAFTNIHGETPATVFGSVPEQSQIPFLSYTYPLSLRIIEERLQRNSFPSIRAFDLEMSRLFEKARRTFQIGHAAYGNVLEIQRLYQRLTSSTESAHEHGVPPPSTTYYASLSAGPGNAKLMPTDSGMPAEEHAFASIRVQSKDRAITREARYKGMSYKLGDFVHVMNADDPSRPIIGQVFRTYIPRKVRNAGHHLTICWYFRPEQIVHTIDRMFYQDEILKTGNFVDHPVEDLIERVGCQYYTKATRGRPKAPEWYPGWPLYVCNSRYNEKDRASIKIKNWGACIPEELRKTEFMSVHPFDKGPHALRLLPSPFKQGIRPGDRGITGNIGGSLGSYKGAVDGEDEERMSERMSDHQMTASLSTPPIRRPVGRPPKVHGAEGSIKRPVGRPPKKPRIDQPGDGSQQHAMIHNMPYGNLGLQPMMQPGYVPLVGGYPMTQTGSQAPFFSPAPPPGYGLSPVPFPQAPRHLPPGQPGGSTYNPYMLGAVKAHPSVLAQSHSGGSPGNYAAVPIMRTSSSASAAEMHRTSSGNDGALPAHTGPVTDFAGIYKGEERLNRMCEVEKLSEDAVNMFDRDPRTGQVLWFSGPPIEVSIPEQPKFSTTYLSHLVTHHATADDGASAAGEDAASTVESESETKSTSDIAPLTPKTLASQSSTSARKKKWGGHASRARDIAEVVQGNGEKREGMDTFWDGLSLELRQMLRP